MQIPEPRAILERTQTTMNFLIDNWQNIAAALTFFVGGARIVVMLTPTPKDNAFLDGFVKVLKVFSLHIEKK